MHITRRALIPEPFEQVPLIFGVVGHVDPWPQHHRDLKRCIRGILLEYRKHTYGHTPIVVFSALAEGCDRLAAQVVRELRQETGADDEHGGVHLIALLPMPPEIYEEDFETDASKQQFRDFLNEAQAIWTMDWACDCAPKNIQRTDFRELQYRAVGDFIAKNSHVLIALWDGVDGGLPAGTAWVHRARAQAIHTAAMRLQRYDPCGYGPSYVITTPRQRSGTPELPGRFNIAKSPPFCERPGSARGARRHPPAEQAHHEQIYSTFETFNHDVDRLRRDTGAAADLERCANQLFPENPPCAGVRASGLPEALQWLRRLFATADLLANRYQEKSHGSLLWMMLFAASGAASLDFYHGLHSVHAGGAHHPCLVPLTAASGLGLVLSSCGAVWSLMRSLKAQDHDRYLAYRSLAESLRVQFFWKLAGVGETVAMHFKGRDFHELDWIRSAADAAWRVTGTHLREAQPPGDWTCWRRCVQNRWVADQQRYFIRAHRREVSRLHQHERAIGLTLRTAVLMAGVCVVLGCCSLCGHHPPAPVVAFAAASLVFSGCLLLANLYCCTLWGERAPKSDADRTGWPFSPADAYALRQELQAALARFKGLLALPATERHLAPEKKAERVEAFACSLWLTIGILALLTIGLYVIASLAVAGIGEIAELGEVPPLTSEACGHVVEFSAITSVGLLLLAAGLFHFRGYRHAFEAHVETYQAMIEIFTEARRRLWLGRNQPSDLHAPPLAAKYDPQKEAQEILKELGADALGENSDWAATHHSRPLEPPLG